MKPQPPQANLFLEKTSHASLAWRLYESLQPSFSSLSIFKFSRTSYVMPKTTHGLLSLLAAEQAR